ncbi:4'-phosphopantetheinyl transferase family protein [Patulibacter defluvii]|uniref:4'-phosphopantetheinyl transferase family protein n=1 Tax=Patulibacter defluvii TaxID=3095358 RepID=UPI002A74DE67|nr:4'-phosphopantetheinyl transferase superfamily protein [Patulibacter sp. DM4]
MPALDASVPPAATVVVWLAALDVAVDDGAAASLSDEERRHAEGLTAARAAHRYRRTRTVLRALLGAALDRPPGSLALTTDPEGKPRLADEEQLALRFNLSHAGGLLAVALSGERRAVGVDVEALDARRRVLTGTLTAAERRALEGLPDERARRAAFLQGWTRKEAYLKGVGCGVRVPLDELGFAASPTGLRPQPRPERLAAEADWTVIDLALGAGHVGALAVAGGPPAVVVRRWVDAPSRG